MTEERRDVIAKTRAMREAVQAGSRPARPPEAVLGASRPTPQPSVAPLDEEQGAGEPPLTAPDATAVNEAWDTRVALRRGGRRARLLEWLLRPVLAVQGVFNARQVQLDNELLGFLVARLEAVHRQYDTVLGIHGRHMQDINARHLILQEELVAHVHDLVRRIDLTLSEEERTRVSLEAELRALRARLLEIENRWPRG